jgi:hypothetical protein
VKFVIARGWSCAGFNTAPSFIVALEVFFRAIWIGEIAGDHDCSGNLFEELCRGLRAGEILAIGDVAGANQDD